MRKFLGKALIFTIFPVLYFVINMSLNRYIYSKQEGLTEKKNILIVGDSHVEKSLDPRYFLSAENISQPAEPLIMTFWKLKKIFKTFIPDTIILGFAPHNISKFNDLKFSNDKWSSEMFRRSYPVEEFNSISSKILIDYKSFYKVLWKQTAFFPKRNHINYIGAYSNSNYSDISDWENDIKRHYYHQDKVLNISTLAISYLDSIVRICESNNVKVILASNPLHEQYLKNIPPPIMKKYFHLTGKYSKNHIIYDKTREIYPDSLYLNSDHLNARGAKRFTIELIKYLDEKRLVSSEIKTK